jgi:hypothetical protein
MKKKRPVKNQLYIVRSNITHYAVLPTPTPQIFITKIECQPMKVSEHLKKTFDTCGPG